MLSIQYTWKNLHQIEGVLDSSEATDQQEDTQLIHMLASYTWRVAKHTDRQWHNIKTLHNEHPKYIGR